MPALAALAVRPITLPFATVTVNIKPLAIRLSA
jgi:hypothetical protein